MEGQFIHLNSFCMAFYGVDFFLASSLSFFSSLSSPSSSSSLLIRKWLSQSYGVAFLHDISREVRLATDAAAVVGDGFATVNYAWIGSQNHINNMNNIPAVKATLFLVRHTFRALSDLYTPTRQKLIIIS